MDKIMIWMILITIFVNSSFSLLTPFYPNVAKAKGVPSSIIGLIIGSFSIAQIITSYIVGRTLEYVGRRRYLMIGIIGCSVTVTCFGCLDWIPEEQTTLFIVASICCRLMNGTFGMCINVSNYSMITLLYKENTIKKIGFLEAGTGLGLLIGPIIGGLIFSVS